MSLGTLYSISEYFNPNYKIKDKKFILLNASLEWYRGYNTEVYAVDKKLKSLLAPVIHVTKIMPNNLRWFVGDVPFSIS